MLSFSIWHILLHVHRRWSKILWILLNSLLLIIHQEFPQVDFLQEIFPEDPSLCSYNTWCPLLPENLAQSNVTAYLLVLFPTRLKVIWGQRFIYFLNIYLAALGLSCITQNFCCDARTPELYPRRLHYAGSAAVVHGLDCSLVCGVLVFWLGVELASPALQGGFLTTELPAKFQYLFL